MGEIRKHKKPTDRPMCISATEFARQLSISKDQVGLMLRRGEIEGMHITERRIAIPVSELDRLREEMRANRKVVTDDKGETAGPMTP